MARVGLHGWLLAAVLLGGGCPAHETGLVRPLTEEGGRRATTLYTIDGETWRLVVTAADAAPLAYLDGHTAEVWGTRIGRAIRVEDWKVPEGLHGMTAWVGVLEENGVQIGVRDRNSQAFYLVDPDSAAELAKYVGKPVLLEGYVEGAHRVRVVYYRVLADG